MPMNYPVSHNLNVHKRSDGDPFRPQLHSCPSSSDSCDDLSSESSSIICFPQNTFNPKMDFFDSCNERLRYASHELDISSDDSDPLDSVIEVYKLQESAPSISRTSKDPESYNSLQLSNDISMQEMLYLGDITSALIQCIQVSHRLDQYRIKKLLGYGTFGFVVEATKSSTGETHAIKIISKSQIHSTCMCIDPKTSQKTPLEISLVKCFPRHPNIIAYVDSWEEKDFWYLVTAVGGFAWNDVIPTQPHGFMPPLTKQRPTLILPSRNSPFPYHKISIPESGNNFSLAGFLKAHGGWKFAEDGTKVSNRSIIDDSIQKIIFRQIFDAVALLCRLGVVHRDLKDEVADANPHDF